jgi:hypothetical protein
MNYLLISPERLEGWFKAKDLSYAFDAYASSHTGGSIFCNSNIKAGDETWLIKLK